MAKRQEEHTREIPKYSNGIRIDCSKATNKFIAAIYEAQKNRYNYEIRVSSHNSFIDSSFWDNRQSIPKDKWAFIKILPYISSEKMVEDLSLQFMRDPKRLSDLGWERHVKSMKRYAKNGYNLDVETMSKIYYNYLKWLM